MIDIDLKELYFDWICTTAFPDNIVKNRYSKVLYLLHNTLFEYTLGLDENRKRDGIDLRYHFSCDSNIPNSIVDSCFNNEVCSVLEMMVALAKRFDNNVMYDISYGDRSALWFWIMFSNLGLNQFDDSVWNDQTPNIISDILYRFFNRTYNPDGSNGGMFIVKNLSLDMRTIQIWDQMSIYINENNYNY